MGTPTPRLLAASPVSLDTAGHSGIPCGYPDLLFTVDRELARVLHPYPDRDGAVDLHWLRLTDNS